MTFGEPSAAAAMYETLARFQWWRRRCARARPGEGLELRKRLQMVPGARPGEGPSDGAAGLDAWLRSRLTGRVPVHARVLDLGCGFGASLLRWVEASDGSGVGITQSSFQVARATAEVRRRGISGRCAFVQQDLAAAAGTGFDIVLAIEAVGHAHDLDAVLDNVHAALRPGGTFVWVEDLLTTSSQNDSDVATLARMWDSPPLRDLACARAAIARAGLRIIEEIDLTSHVPVRPMARVMASARRLDRLRTWLPLPSVRRLLDAFAGGLALERLYARGLACYRVWMVERCAEVS